MQPIPSVLEHVMDLSAVGEVPYARDVYEWMWSLGGDYWVVVIVTYLTQIGSLFVFSLPCLIFQFIPALNKYKIQPDKVPGWKEWSKCLKKTVVDHIAFFPLACLMYSTCQRLGMPMDFDSIPAWPVMCLRLLMSLVVEDAWHYCLHRIAHAKSLYPLVHKVHHEFTFPFAPTAEYAHVVETVVLGMGFFIPLVLFCDHLAFLWAWTILRMWQTCEAHSGYHIWISPFNLLPFYGGAVWHDFHHSNFTGNYGSTFTYWDIIFGTDTGFAKFKAKKRAELQARLKQKTL